MAFLAQVRSTPPLVVACFRGELDLDSKHHITAVVERAVEQGCTVVAVDLSEVSFVDCCALGSLVAAVHRFGAADGELVVTAVSPPVQRLLDLTGTGWLTRTDSAVLTG